jgi:hypothetical protein
LFHFRVEFKLKKFIFDTFEVLDVQVNDLALSDLKIGAIICICLGYFFLILPENIYTDFRSRFMPEPVDTLGASSLTRRYKYNAPASPNTVNGAAAANRVFKANSVSSK